MRDFRELWRRCIMCIMGIVMMAWLMPQTVAWDCVEVVSPKGQTDDLGSGITREQYKRLFQIGKSDYKITWKYGNIFSEKQEDDR